ncbi:MAG: hypothetical protein ABIJ42_03560, partial [Acidobacteriota bacterium]
AEKFALGRKDGNIKHIRSGEIAQWKTAFSPQMKEIFKEHQGDLLIHLGYEKDFNWQTHFQFRCWVLSPSGQPTMSQLNS